MPSEARVIRFPHRRSVGTLLIADESQPEEWELLSQVRALIVTPENQPIKWDWLEEARGKVSVPAGVKLKLKISGKGSGSLAALEALQADDLHTLDLSRSEVSDVSLSHIRHLTGLKVLELTGTNVTDSGLPCLKELTSLTGLGLSHCHVTGQGLIYLKQLSDLRELWLSGADVDDDDLIHLKKFTSLVQLGLSATKITDLGLSQLSGLTKLMRLYLFSTAVTRDGAQNFRQIVPGCRVKWKPRGEDNGQYPLEELDSARDFGLPRQESPEASAPKKHSSLDTGSDGSDTVCGTMTEERFWHVIELLAWQNQGDDEAVIAPAIAHLTTFPEKDILFFADLLSEKLHKLDGKTFASHIGRSCYKGETRPFPSIGSLVLAAASSPMVKSISKKYLATPPPCPRIWSLRRYCRYRPEPTRKRLESH